MTEFTKTHLRTDIIESLSKLEHLGVWIRICASSSPLSINDLIIPFKQSRARTKEIIEYLLYKKYIQLSEDKKSYVGNPETFFQS